MIIILINQHNLKIRLFKPLCQFQTTETSADDNNAFFIIAFNIKAHIFSIL